MVAWWHGSCCTIMVQIAEFGKSVADFEPEPGALGLQITESCLGELLGEWRQFLKRNNVLWGVQFWKAGRRIRYETNSYITVWFHLSNAPHWNAENKGTLRKAHAQECKKSGRRKPWHGTFLQQCDILEAIALNEKLVPKKIFVLMCVFFIFHYFYLNKKYPNYEQIQNCYTCRYSCTRKKLWMFPRQKGFLWIWRITPIVEFFTIKIGILIWAVK